MKKQLFIFSMLMIPILCKAQIIRITQADELRAQEIVNKMTLDEKLDYIGGHNAFYIRAIPRLGLPEIRMADGPQGIRNDTQSTLYPCGILNASTWNKKLINQLGKGLGRDAKARGVSFLLGPGVNIYRSPLCGRNFEYFGEDPYLASETAKEYILGVQSQGVISTIKHFAVNNEEWNRYDVSSDVDERTANEIYLATFRKAVKEAGVGAVMNSYNLLNGVHTTENRLLNISALRNAWNFKGVLMSDWASVHSAIGAANGGLDLEMPYGKFMNKNNLLPAIENGVVSENTINLKVKHILQTLIAFGMLDKNLLDSSIPKDNAESKQTALDLAREGIVLLKNEDNILPIKGSVAVIGPNANVMPTGGGSGNVTPYSVITAWQGIKDNFGKKADLIDLANEENNIDIYTDSTLSKKGFRTEYFNNINLHGEPTFTTTDMNIDHYWGENAPYHSINSDKFSIRWSGCFKPNNSGIVNLEMEGDDGYRIYVNNEQLISDRGDHSVTSQKALFSVEKGKTYNIRAEYFDNELDAEVKAQFHFIDDSKIVQKLKKSKNIVLCVGFNSSTEGEGHDRSFSLPGWQNDLVNKFAEINKNTIVIVNAGGGIDFTKWIDKVKAVIMAWYPGQEGGRAIGEILCGKVNPSGKLPATFDKSLTDNSSYKNYYDNIHDTYKRIEYGEGIFMGYRGYDKEGKEPLFPFGFGLSYTSFNYDNISLTKDENDNVTVEFDIKNSGKMDGSEIAEVYVHEINPSVPRPLKELKGFEKINLKKGEKKHVSVKLGKDAFEYYDINSHDFVIKPGDFEIYVGSSSKNLPLKSTVKL